MVFTIALLFSCEDNSQALKRNEYGSTGSPGNCTRAFGWYTLIPLRIQAILTAPKHVDYTNLSFRYAEFPEGLKVIFFDNDGNENEVLADYGILYDETKLIDLKGNVQLKSHDGSILTYQSNLFWDCRK